MHCGRKTKEGLDILRWEERHYQCKVIKSKVENGGLGLRVCKDIAKGGKFCVGKRFGLCIPSPFVNAAFVVCGSNAVLFLSGLIAFCWGRTRVTPGGPAEDLFNPLYEDCFERLVKLHK